MSVARAMRRKAERDKAKKQRPKGTPGEWTAQQISRETGVKVEQMLEWLETNLKEAQDEMAGNMASLLWEAEDYMATANMVIMLHAVLMTFGKLKTVQNGMGRLVSNITPAMELVDQMGVKRAYEELEKYGVGFEVADFDINSLFDDPGKSETVIARLKAKWRELKL